MGVCVWLGSHAAHILNYLHSEKWTKSWYIYMHLHTSLVTYMCYWAHTENCQASYARLREGLVYLRHVHCKVSGLPDMLEQNLQHKWAKLEFVIHTQGVFYSAPCQNWGGCCLYRSELPLGSSVCSTILVENPTQYTYSMQKVCIVL